MINPANIEAATEFVNRYDELDGMYKGNFGKVNTKVVRNRIDVEKEIEELKKYNKYTSVNFDHHLITKYFMPFFKDGIDLIHALDPHVIRSQASETDDMFRVIFPQAVEQFRVLCEFVVQDLDVRQLYELTNDI